MNFKTWALMRHSNHIQSTKLASGEQSGSGDISLKIKAAPELNWNDITKDRRRVFNRCEENA